jgi:hypothetical protein
LQQLREAIASDHPYRFLIHDRDSIYTQPLDTSIANLRLRVLKAPVDKLPLLENYLPGLCPARMRLPSSKLHRLPDGACGWQIEGRSAATSQRLKLPQYDTG